jgi:zinc protease
MAKGATIPGISFVRELGGITEYLLESNGLRILLAPDPASPVAGCMVTYHVGSRNEAIGYTGATHLLEHLMFKGSERFNDDKGTSLDMLLEEKGAQVNATTWLDRTNYYEIVPRAVLPLAIEIEADRMRTARIDEADRQSEMPVVRNEFERGENSPLEALDKELWAAAFMAHPYHHPTIGWKSDIEGVSIERLKAFYDEFYWPNNATVSIVGGFDEKETLELVRREFGRHPRSPHEIKDAYTAEPKQEGPRRVSVSRAGVNMVGVSHKIPEATHPDLPALLILGSILYENKTSRLHRALIDPALATEVHVLCNQFKDPSLFQTYASLAPDVAHEKVEKIILAEYQKIATDGVTAAEIKEAKRAVRAWVAQKRDGAYAFLASLNEDIAAGDWTRFVTLPEALDAVAASDVKRVAKAYFVPDQSTNGHFINAAV